MASGVNKVILVGHLGGDPEVRYTASGSAVANFTLATSESFNDKTGERQERTEWHRIVAWGKIAELCGEYLHKGRQAYVEGRLQTRQWDDKEGNKRYTTEIVAQTVQFLGGRNERGEVRSEGGESKPRLAPTPNAKTDLTTSKTTAPAKTFDYGPPPMSDDDIPF